MNDTADVSIGSSIFMLAPPRWMEEPEPPSVNRPSRTALRCVGSSGSRHSVCPCALKGPPYSAGLSSSSVHRPQPRPPPPLKLLNSVHDTQPGAGRTAGDA